MKLIGGPCDGMELDVDRYVVFVPVVQDTVPATAVEDDDVIWFFDDNGERQWGPKFQFRTRDAKYVDGRFVGYAS